MLRDVAAEQTGESQFAIAKSTCEVPPRLLASPPLSRETLPLKCQIALLLLAVNANANYRARRRGQGAR